MRNKKGFVQLWILLIIIFIAVLYAILANMGQITIFGNSFYIVNPQLSEELTFWWWALIWIIIQVAIVTAYTYLAKFGIKMFTFTRDRYKIFLDYAKKLFNP